METKRQINSFLHGKEQLKYVDTSYYGEARNETDLFERSYQWNKVFYRTGKSRSTKDLAFLLAKEMHRSKAVNYSTMLNIVPYCNQKVGNAVLLQEKKQNKRQTDLMDIRYLNAHETPELFDLPLVIREIVRSCQNESHLKALALLIVLSRVDELLSCINIPEELQQKIEEIHNLILSNNFSRYTYIAPTRWSSDVKKSEIQGIIRQKFFGENAYD